MKTVSTVDSIKLFKVANIVRTAGYELHLEIVFFLRNLECGRLTRAAPAKREMGAHNFVITLTLTQVWSVGETLQSISAVMFPKVQPGKVMQTEALTCLKSLQGIKYK